MTKEALLTLSLQLFVNSMNEASYIFTSGVFNLYIRVASVARRRRGERRLAGKGRSFVEELRIKEQSSAPRVRYVAGDRMSGSFGGAGVADLLIGSGSTYRLVLSSISD